MERNQAVVLIVVLGAVVAIILATAYFVQTDDGGSQRIGSQRFRTSQSHQRDSAQPLYSRRKDADEERSGQSVAATDGQ